MAEDEQQRHRLEALQGITDHMVARLASGRLTWDEWLEQASRHGRYGFPNTLLIPAQRPTATDVGSYNAWQKRGRQVRRGETGIRIISTRGRPRTVFDMEQTDGEVIEKAPISPAEGLRRLAGLAADLGLYLDRGQGWTYLGQQGQRVQLPPELDDIAAASLLAHQIAHALRPGGHIDTTGTYAAPCHGVRRVLADSVASLVLAELGLPVSHLSFPGPRLWAGTDVRTDSSAAVRVVGDQIVRMATRISRRLIEATAGNLPSAPTPALSATTKTVAPQLTRPTRPVQQVPAGRALPDVRAALADAHRLYQRNLRGSWGARYLAGRGFTHAMQEQWELGLAPRSRQALLRHLRNLGHDDETLLQAGLIKRKDNGDLLDLFGDRILFPFRDEEGEITGFIGRRHDKAPGPKYLNTPETTLFHKGNVLFGLHEGRTRLCGTTRPLLVEGPLDAIAVNATLPAEYAAIAPCGTAITAAHIDAIAAHIDLGKSGLVIALDGDPAGQAGAVRAWQVLRNITGPVEAAVLPQAQDPADLLSRSRQAGVREALLSVTPLADLVIDEKIKKSGGRLEFIESRLAAAQAAAALIAELPLDQIARQVTRVASRTGMAPAEVTALVASAISPDPAPDSAQAQPFNTGQQQPGDRRPSRTTSPERTHRRTA
ncbi:toprim domain-containing protein [Actinomadura macra]|uniref:toprim domain-containing protein n=1 Tax=Actinomadura macra TaxID=46164 RepID=UPI00082CA76E|nr:toprim domain-containing protein [Actinomadura macra]